MNSRHDESITPPSPLGLIKETLGILELVRLVKNGRELIRQPTGNKEPVLVIPGYGTSDRATSLLRRYLKYLNYTPLGWEMGRNNGNVPELLSLLGDKFFNRDRPDVKHLRLIGWSLGGYLARELAREYPDQVLRVITFGSPVIGGPKYTATAGFYVKMGYDLDAIEQAVADR